jgi:hypothetical protein
MSKSNPHGIKPGQKLWYACELAPDGGFEVEVATVGRKWATLVHFDPDVKLSLVTFDVFLGDGGWIGSCFLTQEAYRNFATLVRMWRRFRVDMPYRIPNGLTLAKFREAVVILGVPMPNEDDRHEHL